MILNVTSCEKKENKTVELTVQVTAEEFDKAITEAYKRNKGQISVPGFRRGKAPRKIIENMYGASVFYNDALEIILPDVFSYSITESELKVVGYPKISDINFGDDKSAELKFSVELYPEVSVAEYKGISAEKPAAVVEEAGVDKEIEDVRARNARIQTVNSPAKDGDTAVLDFEGFIDGVPFKGGKGENYDLVIGSNIFIPGFETGVIGMSAGDERDLDLVFPEDYHEELAGKPVLFKVKLKEVKEKVLPELDDEFAKDVSEFDTLAEYRNSIREKLTVSKQEEADSAFEGAVLAKLADSLECDVPDAMTEEYIDNQIEGYKKQLASYGMEFGMYLNMMGSNVEEFRENLRPSAINQIKTTLALEKIAELENISPTDEEIEKYYEDMAKKYDKEPAAVKETVSKEAAVYELKMRAASKIIVANAVALEPSAETDAKEPENKEKKVKKAKAEKKTEVPSDEAAEKDENAQAAEKKPAPKKASSKKAAQSTESKVE